MAAGAPMDVAGRDEYRGTGAMVDLLYIVWPFVVSALHLAISIGVSVHIVLYKRHPRAAIGWIGLVWLSPFLGAILYGLLGINRIRRRAQALRGGLARPTVESPHAVCTAERAEEVLGRNYGHLHDLVRVGEATTRRPLLDGNRVEPLLGGDNAYPRMLEAIRQAEQSITLSSYIFDYDRVGRQFAETLIEAHRRGVQVRVMIDAVGGRYKKPKMTKMLAAEGVPVAEFLPTFLSPWVRYGNLRNHRKILVIDGRRGFTGGMNIREAHQLSLATKYPEADLHFSVEGPVVSHMQTDFAVDWRFCRQEELQGEFWFPPIEPVGDALARGIPEGPDEDIFKLATVMLGAIDCARTSIHICTPYFLPEEPLLASLVIAALRGVQVDILLPQRTNQRLVQWSTVPLWPELLEAGCRIWRVRPPFEHTKLMLVDGTWSLFGSANWDPRSLRLNFEFCVECYDSTLNARLEDIVAEKLDRADPVSLDDVEARSLPVKIRDGAARLISPYL